MLKQKIRKILEKYADLEISALPDLIAFDTDQALTQIIEAVKGEINSCEGKCHIKDKLLTQLNTSPTTKGGER